MPAHSTSMPHLVQKVISSARLWNTAETHKFEGKCVSFTIHDTSKISVSHPLCGLWVKSINGEIVEDNSHLTGASDLHLLQGCIIFQLWEFVPPSPWSQYAMKQQSRQGEKKGCKAKLVQKCPS